MPLELIGHDMSTVNFASARIGLLQYYRACRKRQASYKAVWARVFRWWVSRERKRQQLGLPNAFANPFPAEFFAHTLHARAWDYTDPVREAQSDFLQIDMGVKSPQQVATERGRDPEEVVADIAAWHAMLRIYGLPTDIRSTLSRDVISVRAQDPSEVEGMDVGKAPPDEDVDDPSTTPDTDEDEQ